MTEVEWTSSTDLSALLAFVRGKANKRKALLFAAASFLRLGYLLPDKRQHRGIEMLEEMAEGTTTMESRREMTRDVRHALPLSNFVASDPPIDDPHYVALMLYRAIVSSSPAEHAWHAYAGLAEGAEEQRAQTCLFRDIFGNAFRSASINCAWNRWQDCTVPKLAQAIYDERAFDRLPILADALEEAGCANADIIAHCRGPGPHVRGCWVVDLLLGKN